MNFNKLITKTIVISMTFNTAFINMALAEDTNDITDVHTCSVTKKSTHEVVDAICGKKALPEDPGGPLFEYRTFTDPDNSNKVEQYRVGKNKVRTITAPAVAQPEPTPAPQIQEEQPQQATQAPQLEQQDDGDGWGITEKGITIGFAVVAVVGSVMGVRAMRKSSKNSQLDELGRKIDDLKKYEEDRKNAMRTGRPAPARMAKDPILRDLPKTIKMSKGIPGTKKGTKVKVAGAVPKASVPKTVPRFRTDSGQTYIIQQNPNSGLLETIILYDSLRAPYFYPHAMVYDQFIYSPFIMDASNTIVIREDLSSQSLSYDSNTYVETVHNSQVSETSINSYRSSSDQTTTVDQSDYSSYSGSSSSSSSSSDYTTPSSGSDYSSSSSSSSSSDYSSSSSSTDYSSSSSSSFDSGSSW